MKKIIGIIICMLLVGTILPVSGTINVTHDLESTGENYIYNINNHRAFYSDDFYLDIVITNNDAKTLTVLIGRGNGQFDLGQTIPSGNDPFGITTGDFNMDGFLDLAVTHNDDDKVSIFIGDGLGGFELLEIITVGEDPVDVVTGLFNDDEFIDLAVARFAIGGFVSILLGDGLGGFGEPQHYSTKSGTKALIAEDFDDDGNLDIATANYGSGCVSILLGDGMGGFEDYQYYDTIGFTPEDLVAGDFNSDNILDLAVVISWDAIVNGTVNIFLGDGNGGFGTPENFIIGVDYWSRQIVTNDFDGDGNLDLATTNSIVHSISILFGDGTGGFGTPETYPATLLPFGIISADFNKDDFVDLAIVGNGDDTVVIYLGDGSGGFRNPYIYGVGDDNGPIFLVTGDFNTKKPPEIPIIEGPTSGKAGEEYCWTFSSVDPDGDDIMYIIDWDDGETTETECYPSGLEVEECHTYAEPGTYIIRIKAKDCPDGLESNWATYTVTMPRNRKATNNLMMRFLDQFPILQTLLQRLGLH